MILDSPIAQRDRFSLQGELRLRFERAADRGETILTDRYRRGLFHFAKPYREGSQLVLQVLNPTAGLFSGDRMKATIGVDSGASVGIVAPSSTQIYAMPDGGWAESTLHLSVASGGVLSYLPRWSVLHRGARFRQSTRIEVAPDATLFYLEPISLGRAAHGERLEFEWIESSLEIRRGDCLTVREHWKVGREERPWVWCFRGLEATMAATIYAILPHGFPRFEECESALRTNFCGERDTLCGLTALDSSVYALRILSRNNLALGTILTVFRSFLPNPSLLPDLSNRIL